MRRIVLLFTVAAMMAVLLSISAGPASALVIIGDKDNGHKFNHDRNGFFSFGDDDNRIFRDRFDNDGGEVSFELGDVDNESGDVELDNSFEISGNNNNACLGQQQFGNSGNFTNQQGAFEFGGGFDDFDRNHRGDRDGFVIVSDDDDDFFGFDRDRRRDHGFFDFGNGNNNNGDLEFSGPEVTFAPENETTCDQDVEQAAAASSWGSWW